MNQLFILGAGGHGAVVAEAAVLSQKWGAVSFLDDAEDIQDSVVGCPVVGTTSMWQGLISEDLEFFVAMGNNKRRDEILASIEEQGGALATILHPSAVVSPSAIIKLGVVVCAGAVVNTRASIGRGSIVNTCASIDHDCVLDNATHISPGAHVAGGVTIGAHTWIGIGAVVRQGVTIGSDCVVGAGAAVISDVGPGQSVAGIPASPMRTT